MSPDLSRRLGAALAAGFPTADERDRVVAAAEPVRVRTFADLPPDIQDLVLRLEGDPAT